MAKRKVATRRLVTAKARAAELERGAQRDWRERLKKRIREIRAQVSAVRRAEKLALFQVKDQCRRSRARARARVRARRAEVMALLRAEAAQLMGEARRACEGRKAKVRKRSAKAMAELEKQAKAVAMELAADKLYREFQRGGPAPSTARRKSGRTERRQESDDEVRRNLEPALVPIFDAVRRSIHGTSRRSRTEDFLHWAEENPDDVLTIRAELGDRAFQKELKAHLEQEKQIARLLKRKGKLKRAELEAVGISPAELERVGLDPSDPAEVESFLQGPAGVVVEEEDIPF